MQLGKVEISGVNTSGLTVLTEKEKQRLIALCKKGDTAAREQMINGNLKLVLSVIQRFANRGESADDLFQVGCIGLIKAIDNFDTSHGVRFSTYAVPMIIGEIKRYLRDNNSVRVSRSVRDLAYKIMQTKERLRSETQTEPTVSALARELSVDPMDIVTALESAVDPMSLYEPLFADDGDSAFVMDQIRGESCEGDWICEIQFKQAIERLNERERTILYLRFMRGKTQMEVAGEIGISQAQVSRLEKSAIKHIKETI